MINQYLHKWEILKLTVFDTRSNRRSKLETRQSHKCSFDSSLCLAGKVLKNLPQELNGKSRPWRRRMFARYFSLQEIASNNIIIQHFIDTVFWLLWTIKYKQLHFSNHLNFDLTIIIKNSIIIKPFMATIPTICMIRMFALSKTLRVRVCTKENK